MSELFPPIHENRHFYLPVDDLHEIYVEECGDDTGIPVVFLHGGPGSGCEPYHRQLFDPEKYRIILFDQRGCGRSKPHAELRQNTTQDLVADIEKIRKYLGIDKWVVAGGSWGSTLALAYAEAHPEAVSGLIIRGIYFCTAKEIQWFYQYGTSQFYPDYWQDFLAPIPADEQDDLLQAYYKRLTGDNEIARMQAAKAWSLWEARTATLRPHKALLDHFSNHTQGIKTVEFTPDGGWAVISAVKEWSRMIQGDQIKANFLDRLRAAYLQSCWYSMFVRNLLSNKLSNRCKLNTL